MFGAELITIGTDLDDGIGRRELEAPRRGLDRMAPNIGHDEQRNEARRQKSQRDQHDGRNHNALTCTP
jgi:hypothetical protein